MVTILNFLVIAVSNGKTLISYEQTRKNKIRVRRMNTIGKPAAKLSLVLGIHFWGPRKTVPGLV